MLLCLLHCARPSSDLYGILEEISCPNESDFGGMGIGKNETAALAQARSNMAQEYFSEKQKSDIKIREQNIDGKASRKTDISINQNATLFNPADAELHYSKRQGDKTGVVACMSRSNAAKGFVERERLIADSLELLSNVALNTKHPKNKNDAWHKSQMLWSESVKIRNRLEDWGVGQLVLSSSAQEVYSKIRDDYRNYCQTWKAYWVDMKNEYSDIVFAELSKRIKMEKSTCQGDGISLVYKKEKTACSYKFGLYSCSGKISLSLASCEGAEYLLLENTVEAAHQKQDFALEKMQNGLKTADFWVKLEKEIKEWVPQCAN
jgi:hypothetical protein